MHHDITSNVTLTFLLKVVQHTKQLLQLTWYTSAFPMPTIDHFPLEDLPDEEEP